MSGSHASLLRAPELSTGNAPAGAFEESAEANQLEQTEKFRLANQHATRRRSDALVLMAEAFLRDTKVASCTADH
ncbi:MAG: hypothetical protein ACI9UN_003307 [Granulosicoccus sp.]